MKGASTWQTTEVIDSGAALIIWNTELRSRPLEAALELELSLAALPRHHALGQQY